MPIYYGNSGRLSVSNWRDALETIKAGREEYKKYYSIMTPYERSIIERDLQAKKEQYKSLMTNGILGEYQTALDLYQLAQKKIDRERAKEINRWEAGKLSDEMDVYAKRIQIALSREYSPLDPRGTPPMVLEGIYQEAIQSGDKHKMRAASELIRGALSVYKGSDQYRIDINRIAKRADRDLEELRTTDDIKNAIQAKDEAWNSFWNVRKELIDVGTIIDGYDPSGPMAGGEFAKAIRRVTRDQDTGEVIVLPAE